jgi:hypothetical protein
MVSERTYYDLKQMLEEKPGSKSGRWSRARWCLTGRDGHGWIKGTDQAEQELVLTGHLFEGLSKQGANDDASGCVLFSKRAG